MQAQSFPGHRTLFKVSLAEAEANETRCLEPSAGARISAYERTHRTLPSTEYQCLSSTFESLTTLNYLEIPCYYEASKVLCPSPKTAPFWPALDKSPVQREPPVQCILRDRLDRLMVSHKQWQQRLVTRVNSRSRAAHKKESCSDCSVAFKKLPFVKPFVYERIEHSERGPQFNTTHVAM